MNTLKQDAANNVRSGYYVLKKKPKLKIKKKSTPGPLQTFIHFLGVGKINSYELMDPISYLLKGQSHK